MKFCTAFLAFTSFYSALLPAQTPPAPKVPGTLAVPVQAPGTAADPNKIVLAVGDTKLTAKQFDELIAALPANAQAYARSGKRQFAENLVQLFVMANEGERLKLDNSSKVQEQLAFQRKNIMAGALFENLQQNAKVDDAAIQQYYDAHKDQYEAVKAKHILIRVKGAPMPATPGKPELDDAQALSKAQEIRKKLVSGGDFTALAKAESDDTTSGAQGGDLGEFHKGQMVPPFEQAAFALKPGEISEPVKTPFGYHIIVVSEHQSKPLADVKPEIERLLRPDLAKKVVDDLRAKSNVQIDDAFFGPATPPTIPPQTR